MGGYTLWPHFGINAGPYNDRGRTSIDTYDRPIGIEGNGLISRFLWKRIKEKTKAKGIVEHIKGATLPDPELIISVARDVVAEIGRIASCSGETYVVSEGNFPLKTPEKVRREKRSEVFIDKKDYRNALAVPDCLLQLVMEAVIRKDRDAELMNVKWIDLELTEGEFQLLFMLNSSVIDAVLLYSADADAAIISSSRGCLVLQPRTEGLTGARKKKGHKAVRVTGIPVIFDGITSVWGAVQLNPTAEGRIGKEQTNLSTWDTVNRAVFAAVCGHDYDSKSTITKTPQPSGLKSIGSVKAFKGLRECIESGQDIQDGSLPVLTRVEQMVRFLKPDLCDDDVKRMQIVAIGFIMHPVVYFSGRGAPVLKVPTRYARHRSDVQTICTLLVQTGHSEFAAEINAGFSSRPRVAKSGFVQRRPCTPGSCGIDNFESAVVEADAAAVIGIVESIGIELTEMTAVAQPTITHAMLAAAFQEWSAASPNKHFDEGLKRAYDSARIAGTMIGIASHLNPPICVIKETEAQSQGRYPYTTAARFELTSDLMAVKKITKLTCTCHRKTANVICKHRAALLCRMWTNSVFGLAGNPVEREAYWKRRAVVLDKTEATRVTKLLTNRTADSTLATLIESEVTADGPMVDDHLQNADSDTDNCVTALGPLKKRRRFVDSRKSTVRNNTVNSLFHKHFTPDLDRLHDIGLKYDVVGFQHLKRRTQTSIV